MKRYKSITSDNGSEFLDSDSLCKSIDGEHTRLVHYFAHPYSSFERGTNENHNRMIRRFIPKGCDISKFTKQEIKRVQDYMNNYPRKLFGGLSSLQYKALICDS